MAVITVPSPDEEIALFEEYALALGKVAHAWNMLFERLGRLFTVATQMHPPAALAIWNAPDSDRTKLEMLRATASNLSDKRWSADFPQARDDILWLSEKVRNLTDLRNNAIHAPCSLVITSERATIRADLMSGHARAQKMKGKEILIEFDYCERWSDLLSYFAEDIREALLYREYGGKLSPWPGRPAKPDRLDQNHQQTASRRGSTKAPKHPPQSSQA